MHSIHRPLQPGHHRLKLALTPTPRRPSTPISLPGGSVECGLVVHAAGKHKQRTAQALQGAQHRHAGSSSKAAAQNVSRNEAAGGVSGAISHSSVSSNGTGASGSTSSLSWSGRMASIQALMSRVQEQLHSHSKLQASNPALAARLKEKASQHLELLMQLAEAEQKHITGELDAEQLQQLLAELSHHLDEEQQEAAAAIQQSLHTPGGSSSGGSGGGMAGLLGSSAEVREAIGKAAIAAEQYATGESILKLQARLQETEAQLEAAESALADTQQLRMDYDRMCQQSFELSRKLSVAEGKRAELQRQLADAKARLSASSEEVSEHNELQMQYDKLCQDMYRLRMQLQKEMAQSSEVATDAAANQSKHKQDVAWLMKAHRKEMAEQHNKQQELMADLQQLRMKLLQQEQQLWGQTTSGGAPGTSAGAATAAAEQAGRDAALVAQAAQQQQQVLVEQEKELALLKDSCQALMQEKQQLMRNLQDMQREQAVLLVELQHVREQQRQQEEAGAEAMERTADQELAEKLERAEQQRNSLIQQVQQLQESLQDARAAAAAAAAARSQVDLVPSVPPAADAGAALAASEQLREVKAEVVQLRGQLAATRRELQLTAGRAGAAEAALQAQAADYEARLQQLQVWYNKQALVVAQLRKGKPAADVGFTNSNRFWVRQELLFEFSKHWVAREALLQQQPGFLALQVEPQAGITADGGMDVVVRSMWASPPDYEAWRNNSAGQQLHMPTGVYQYVPRRGEGFPEDFVPFRDYDEAVNAKY